MSSGNGHSSLQRLVRGWLDFVFDPGRTRKCYLRRFYSSKMPRSDCG
jgi:hypothetical protein